MDSVVLVYLLSMCFVVRAQDTNSEVFNVEHLKDFICVNDDSGMTRHSGVLIMYETSCVDKLHQLGLSKIGLPTEQYLVYMEHDIARIPRCHWYDLPKEDQLATHFPVIGCPTAYFIGRDSKFNYRPKVWMASSSNLTFTQWVWEQVQKDVVVKNSGENAILVQAGGGGQQSPAGKVVMPGKKVTLKTHESHLLMAFSLNSETGVTEFYEGWLVNKDLNAVEVKAACGKSNDDWVREINTQEEARRAIVREWMYSHTYRHTLNIKQALIVPQYTEKGYEKRKMPSDLYKPLAAHYHANKYMRQKEQHSVSDSILNQDEVRCFMVHLDDQMKTKLADGLRPVLEEWSGLKLQVTAIYGIREYYNGSVLKNHVDRLETHVISVIMQVDKELEDQDWPLEVINYNGKRLDVYLEPGDMLLYESARLIHGRPRPFRGHRFANIFMHFKPVDGWNYKVNQKGEVIHFLDKTEKLNPIDTDLTKKWKTRKDEL